MKLTIFALLLISLSACEKSTITNGTGKKEQTTGNSGGSNDGSSGAHIPNNLTNNGSSGTNIPNNSTNNGSSGAPISNNPVPATGSGTKTTGTGTAPTPTAAPTGSGANPATGNSGGSSGSNNNLRTTFDWRSKNLEEIKNFKDANGKNLFELTMNKPEELKELIKKLGDKEALDMALEGDKPPVSDYDNSIITTKSPLPIAIENDDEQALDVLLTIPNIETKLGEKINDNQELKGHDVHNRSSPTLLHIAADKGNIKSFKKIIKI